MKIPQLDEVDIRQAVAVGGKEVVTIQVFPRLEHPSPGFGFESGVGNSDGPFGVAVQLDPLSNLVAQVADREHEISEPVLRVPLHDVPENRFITDLDEHFRHRLRVLTEACPPTSTQNQGFHSEGSPSGLHPQMVPSPPCSFPTGAVVYPAPWSKFSAAARGSDEGERYGWYSRTTANAVLLANRGSSKMSHSLPWMSSLIRSTFSM